MTPEDQTLTRDLLARGTFDAQTIGRLQAAADTRGVSLATVVTETGVKRALPTNPLRALAPATPPTAWAQPKGAHPRAQLDVPTVLDRPRRVPVDATVVDRSAPLGPPTEADAAPPTQLGPFRVVSKIAEGGMGIVYRAYHEGLQRECAVKVLSPELRWDDETVERFLAETRMAAKVGAHPNLVGIYDAGSSDGHIWLAMELVVGTTLGKEIAAERLSPREGAALLVKVCDGLTHVHAQGIIHRDIKPDNILLDEQGVPKLGDFGIAKTAESGSLTTTGSFLGTPSYVAPEQAEDARLADARSDVYGLGAVFYAVLTGRPPYIGASAVAVMANLLAGPPPAPRDLVPKVDPQLEAVCLRALERDPTDRYASAAELGAAFEKALAGEGPSPTRRPTGRFDRRRIGQSSDRRGDSGRLPEGKDSPSRRGLLALGAGAALMAVAAAVAVSASRGEPDEPDVVVDEPDVVVTPRPTATPRLVSLEPGDGAAVASPLTLTGRVTPNDLRLRVRIKSAGKTRGRNLRARNGRFAVELDLPEGEAELALVAPLADAADVELGVRRYVVDATHPALDVTPVERVSEPWVDLIGTCSDANGVTLEIDGEQVELQGDVFERRVTFSEPGPKTIRIVARDGAGLETTRERVVTYEVVPVALELDGERGFTQQPALTLRGRVRPPSATLTVDGEAVSVSRDGAFASQHTLREGLNTFELVASHGGHDATLQAAVTLDRTAPTITLPPPYRGREPKLSLALEFSEPIVAISVRDQKLELPVAAVAAQIPLELSEGRQEVRISATDRAGNVGELLQAFEVDSTPPVLEAKVDWKKKSASAIRGTVRDSSSVILTRDGDPIDLKRDQAFTVRLRGKGLQRPPVTLVATDAFGNETRRVFVVGLDALLERSRWIAADEAQQDAEIEIARRILGKGYEHVATRTYESAGVSNRVGVFRHKKLKAGLVLLPGAKKYRPGIPAENLRREMRAMTDLYPPMVSRMAIPLEASGRSVKLGPFLIGQTELRCDEWDRLKVARPADAEGFPGDSPIFAVTWAAASQWLARAGGGLRLPSEAEWEYACRAGSTTRFFWGDDFDDTYCVTANGNDPNQTPWPAADLQDEGKLNAFGLVHMAGNAFEWCADTFASYDGSAIRPNVFGRRGGGRPLMDLNYTGNEKILRGGSCRVLNGFARTTARFFWGQNREREDAGFRVVRSLLPTRKKR